MAVDEYFKQEIYGDPAPEPETFNALFRVLEYDEYDDIYGCDWDEDDTPFHKKMDAYKQINTQPDKVIILSKCPHFGSNVRLHRHHPDYTRPFEVELLCASCHRRKHKKQYQIPKRTGHKPGGESHNIFPEGKTAF